jgi:hypothetical protein
MNASEVTQENYFEVYEACHTWLSLNHGGQWTDEYKLLSQSVFNPGPMWTEGRVMQENEYYPKINKDNVRELFYAAQYLNDLLP